jgi:hypothetical protein
LIWSKHNTYCLGREKEKEKKNNYNDFLYELNQRESDRHVPQILRLEKEHSKTKATNHRLPGISPRKHKKREEKKNRESELFLGSL